ncbi:MAG: heavy-metal-associated domain-containing protein [Thiohalomonadales bacterium]
MQKFIMILLVTLLLGLVSACSGENKSVTTVIPADAQKVNLAVSNMTCSTCGPTVRKSLMNLEGVFKASVDTESGIATVYYDAAKCTTDQLTTATRNAGYPSKVTM